MADIRYPLSDSAVMTGGQYITIVNIPSRDSLALFLGHTHYSRKWVWFGSKDSNWFL